MSKIFADVGGATTANDGLSLDKWMQRLLVRFMGAPEALLRAELIDSVREFYKESCAWREQVGPFHVYGGNELIWVNPIDAYSEAVFIRRVWIQKPGENMRFLEPLSLRQTDGSVGEPRYFSLPDPYVIRLWPKPDVDMGPVLWIDTTLCPLPDSTRFPNVSLSHHFDAILNVASARIFMIPNKPWTDLALGMRFSQLSRREITRFRSQSDQGYTNSDTGWKFPSFA